MAHDYKETIEQAKEDSAITQELITSRIKSILSEDAMLRISTIDRVTDASWIKESSNSSVILDGDDRKTRFYSTADNKFEDTSVGGNWTINPLPQLTRYADPRSKGILQGRESVTVANANPNIGMGHYYSEAFDDSKQVIHMRFGKPEYNSMISFFTGFFDNDVAQLARTGSVVQDFTYLIGRAVGLVINIIFWPLLLAHSVGYALKFFMGKPASKYYYLRPTMQLYWTAVTTMLNQIAVYKRMLPVNPDSPYPKDKGEIDQATHEALQQMLPGIYTESGYIDVYKIANRAQKIRNFANKQIDDATAGMGPAERIRWAKEKGGKAWLSNPGEPDSLASALEKWLNSKFGRAEKGDDTKIIRSLRTPKISGSGDGASVTLEGDSPDGGLIETFNAEWNDGSAFATFRVDYGGSVDESFSNTSVESDIAQKFNSYSAQGRAASFSMAGGNIDNGLITAAFDAAKGLASGLLSSIHMDGLLSLAGAAFVDIPKHWDNSTANLPKMNYTMQLVSPYGNPVSQLMNIHLPLCMILAAALPTSTGAQSYTSPFLVELYDPGRAQTRLGMIDSLTIVRGTTNLGFNKRKQFMSADVSFNVVDLSSVMHMPLNSGMFNWNGINPMRAIFGEDNSYTDYLHVLAGASLHQSVYKSEKLKDNARAYYRRLQALTSSDRWVSWIHESPIGMLDIIMRGTTRN